MNVLALSFMPPAPGRVVRGTRTRHANVRTTWRHVLGCCAALSVVGHLALLNSLTWEPRRPALTQAAAHRAGQAMATRVRFVTPERPSHAPALPTPESEDKAPVDPTPVARDAALLEPEVQPQPQPIMQAPEHAAMPDAAMPGAVAQGGTATGLEQFIPRPQLTLPPEVLAPVILVAPEDDKTPARHVGILSLYIDQTGRVHHITSEDAGLPPAYERIAREAFMAATFRPGQLDGQDVKSRIRIEVVFDNTPLDSP